MFCTNCGMQCDDKATFCTQCGQSLTSRHLDAQVHNGTYMGGTVAPERVTNRTTSYENVHQGGNIDVAALSGLVSSVPGISDVMGRSAPKSNRLSKKERRAQKKEVRKGLSAAKKESTSQKKKYKSINQQLKERDKELSNKTSEQRQRRKKAKDVVSFIGYNCMYQDGICEVEEGLFSTTITFSDTSYHSVRDDMQKGIFSSMNRLYDQLGADTLVQMNIINTPLLSEEIGSRNFFDPWNQNNENASKDAVVFNEILNNKMREGVSNIRRERFMTIAVSANTAEESVPKLARIESESSRILTSVGSRSRLLKGEERLRVIHSQLNPLKPFIFSYEQDISACAAQSTKDAIAPSMLDFRPEGYSDCFKTDGVWGQVLVIKKFGSDLSDNALSDIVSLPIALNVTWLVQPMDKAKAVAFVKQRAAWINKEIIEAQQSSVRKGYDMNILPTELKYSKEETEDVLDHLQNKNQRFYVFTSLIYTYAETKEQLDSQVLQIISAARQHSIEIGVLEYRQREGLNSILPLGHNHINISRMLTTAQVGILIPFATQELDERGGNYYGQNKQSNNLVVCNRKNLTSPMGFVCGKTGSGKGMFTKTEMVGTILSNPSDEIYIIDRAGEYTGIADRYGGSTFTFSVGSETYLNPFDTVSVGHLSTEEQVAFKIDALLAQAAASAAESGQFLSEIDQSIITRCADTAFEKAASQPEEERKAPLLEDFYSVLMEQPEEQAKLIATRYERFIKGPMSFFNKQSNVRFDNRIIDFNLKELQDSMLVFGLINVCEAVRNRMYFNSKRNVRTWLYVEEMQSLFAYPTVLNYFSRFANEGRKFGLLLTGITQNAVAMLKNEAAQNIVLNADFLMLLKQSPIDRREWTRLLSLSDVEEGCIDESVEAGDGLLIAGNARIPLRGKFPSGNTLYELFSTNPNEVKEAKETAS